MASQAPTQKFPMPTYNRIIDNDPQIVRYPTYPGWSAREGYLNSTLTANPVGQDSGEPKAPEMGIVHVTSKD